MNRPDDFVAWRDRALAEGFDEVAKRQWPPDTEIGEHAHPFALQALVVEGDLWLTVAGNTRHLQAGDVFALDREVAHSERFGSDGAAYWVARRNRP